MGSGGPKCLHLPLLSAQLISRASHAHIHTVHAGQIYACAGTPRSQVGAVRGKWCALFLIHILFFKDFLPSTTPILTPRASALEPEKNKLSIGVHRSENSVVAAKLCLKDPYWPPLPKTIPASIRV